MCEAVEKDIGIKRLARISHLLRHRSAAMHCALMRANSSSIKTVYNLFSNIF